ncbi:hypothetical protein RhiirA1_533993 [Rhizophagus irregularis]|uniref:L domain-like protein n=3 Tax=Rhizophagus irregularis TaxID=588596 RepID=U9ULY3_RHIID|nr:hypothetical protein GLOIN_2v1791705 [Rhizophagus irregularis DAOM 181602=DAOM 197198]EXX63033.1 hypothetical protein RirG_156150 [Rhizophagus irregularis DAOM 197198w]PKC68692.1 hypothetical protein RhiirA1_533993 [Rhizophagus irregularis]PKY31692.1 hypothetical protein RhiirB3_531719 [Rhizophagus irregularis]POG57258.1 hypothetical protein GLOIN_2v1791705 [Rhizophagus irregularis DAOM 181602=DAOM 197198]UZO09829.1 hypothetical protein OCT59_030042 [Rhizophagus irregularis]|eukprot:XP_025164399.1 hypothetical protein GLOIN_2v1791705 [Rhizophagus irregularis DAOM 181602=DAOM 197198]
MVNAQEYLDSNYPKGGVREAIEGEIDLSNRSLEGGLNFGGFINVHKLNFSFNEISGLGFGYGEKKLEVLDASHNRLGPTIGGYSYSLKFVNFSNNFYSKITLGMISLTHLDVSNNALTSLSIESSGNLTELKCYGNPLLTNLTLAPNLNINSFSLSDCPALSLLKPTSTTPSSPQPENSNELSNSDKISLGTGLGVGIPGLILTLIGTWYSIDEDRRWKIKRKLGFRVSELPPSQKKNMESRG